jgi:hypothetical protein
LTFIFGTLVPPVVCEAEAVDDEVGLEVVSSSTEFVSTFVVFAAADGAVAPEVDDVLPESGSPDGDAAVSESGAACATPGLVATAMPTPSDTARAPTRPMCLA